MLAFFRLVCDYILLYNFYCLKIIKYDSEPYIKLYSRIVLLINRKFFFENKILGSNLYYESLFCRLTNYYLSP